MNLRKENLPVVCQMSEEKLEAFFAKGEVAAKLQKVEESVEFKKELERVMKNLAEFAEELEEEMGDGETIKEIVSQESVMQHVRMNVMINSVGIAAESIILDGAPAAEAVEKVITADFVIQILHGMAEVIEDKLPGIMVAKHIGNAIFKELEDLFS